MILFKLESLDIRHLDRGFCTLGRKIINPSGGYPPDIHRMRFDLWPMSVERRFQSMRWTLHLGNERLSFARNGARRSLATNRISSGGYPSDIHRRDLWFFGPGGKIHTPDIWRLSGRRIYQNIQGFFLFKQHFLKKRYKCR